MPNIRPTPIFQQPHKNTSTKHPSSNAKKENHTTGLTTKIPGLKHRGLSAQSLKGITSFARSSQTLINCGNSPDATRGASSPQSGVTKVYWPGVGPGAVPKRQAEAQAGAGNGNAQPRLRGSGDASDYHIWARTIQLMTHDRSASPRHQLFHCSH